MILIRFLKPHWIYLVRLKKSRQSQNIQKYSHRSKQSYYTNENPCKPKAGSFVLFKQNCVLWIKNWKIYWQYFMIYKPHIVDAYKGEVQLWTIKFTTLYQALLLLNQIQKMATCTNLFIWSTPLTHWQIECPWYSI